MHQQISPIVQKVTQSIDRTVASYSCQITSGSQAYEHVYWCDMNYLKLSLGKFYTRCIEVLLRPKFYPVIEMDRFYDINYKLPAWLRCFGFTFGTFMSSMLTCSQWTIKMYMKLCWYPSCRFCNFKHTACPSSDFMVPSSTPHSIVQQHTSKQMGDSYHHSCL